MQAEKAEVVANCDHIQNLTTPPELTSKEGWHLGCAAKRRRQPTQRRCHSDDDHEGQKKPEISCGGATRLGHIPAAGEYDKEAALVFYVAATRAMQRLVITVARDSEFTKNFPIDANLMSFKSNTTSQGRQ